MSAPIACSRAIDLEGFSTVCGAPIPRAHCPANLAECPYNVPRKDDFEMNRHDPGLLERATEALDRVRAIHQPRSSWSVLSPGSQFRFCVECRQAWPCETQKALGVRP